MTAKPANKVAGRALDRPHPGGIAVGAHVRLDESRPAFGDDLTKGFFKSGVVDDILEQGETGRGLSVETAHDDQAMLRKFGPFSKGGRGFHVRDDRMATVGLRAR